MLEPSDVQGAPVEAWPVELDGGGLGVEWTDEYRPAETGPMLPAFLELGDMEPAELAPAVAAFVRRFGPLELCEAHGRDHLHSEGVCTPVVRPEPVETWRRWSDHAWWALTLAESARTAEAEGRTPREVLEGIFERRGWDRSRGIYAVERRGRVPDPDGRLWHSAFLSSNRLHTLDRMPDTAAGVWDRLGREMDVLLAMFPARVEARASAGGIRLHLRTAGVLGRVLLEVAQEVAGSGSVAWCDGCGRPHGRERAPKRGQGCYCSGRCRKRAHARRRRSA